MDWISGETLTDFVENNLWDPVHLNDIAAEFRRVVLDLESHGLAHGDLQHGNILVRPNRRLTLIDYDGMYVPAMSDRTSHEGGHPNYQHPKRGAKWGPGIDRFSAWVIHATLKALATEPQLWHDLHNDPDQLLLDAASFKNWPGCPARARLRSSPNLEVRRLAEIVDALLACDDAMQLPPLTDGHATTTSTASPLITNPRTPPSESTAWAADIGGGWLQDHLTQQQLAPDSPVAAVSPSAVKPEASKPLRAPSPIEPIPAPRRPADVAALARSTAIPGPEPTQGPAGGYWAARLALLAILLAGGTTLGLVTAYGKGSGLVAFQNRIIAVTAVTLLMLAVTTVAAYLIRPERAMVRPSRQAEQQASQQAAGASSRLSAAIAGQRDVFQRNKRTAKDLRRQAKSLTDSFHHKITDIPIAITRERSELQQKLHDLRAEEESAIRTLDEQAAIAALASVSIPSQRVTGIGESLVSTLRQCGIATFADFEQVRVESYSAPPQSGNRRERALFVSPNGNEIHVKGIGPVKGRALSRRREQLLADLRRRTKVASQDVKRVRTRYDQQRRATEMQIAALGDPTNSEKRRDDILRDWQTATDKLRRKIEQTRKTGERAQEQADQAARDAALTSARAADAAAVATAARKAAQQYGFGRYLAELLVGGLPPRGG